MAFRDDITIDWDLSPRIIEVASPSTELNVQDLYDTLRVHGSYATNMDDLEIVDASGKEQLGTNLYIGLTIKLLNAKVKFEDKESPTVCDIVGGNLIAIDEYSTIMNPIEPSSHVTVTKTASTSAALVGFNANSIWAVSKSSQTILGSMGKAIVDTEVKADDACTLILGK